MTTTIGSSMALPILTAPIENPTTTVSIPLLGIGASTPAVTASVLSAAASATVFVLDCPENAIDDCQLGKPTITVASGAFDFVTHIQDADETVTRTDSSTTTITGSSSTTSYSTHCAMSDQTMQSCAFTNIVGPSTQITTTSGLKFQSDYNWLPLTITAGAEKLTGAQYFPASSTSSTISRSVVSVIPVEAKPSSNAAARRRIWV